MNPEKRDLPNALNLVLACTVLAIWTAGQVCAASLFGLSLAAFAFVFSFLALPLYSLLHEAEHNLFHRARAVNDMAGIVLAAVFGGSFSFLRACHLGHHRRNRTEAELFDIIRPGDSPCKKRAFFYFMYTGGFWLTVPVSMIPLLFWPSLLKSSMVQNSVSASAMVNGIPRHFYLRIRAECIFVLALHAALIYSLNLNPWVYILLLFAGGVNWSSQQYVTHANSPAHVLNGAHNLRTSRLYESWLLHFNWHLAHHQNPGVPWLYLPLHNDASRKRPGYLRSFLVFWKGPQRRAPTIESE